MDLSHLTHLSLLLRDADFRTATDAAAAIEREFGEGSARAIDSRRIQIRVPGQGAEARFRPTGARWRTLTRRDSAGSHGGG